MKKSFLFSLILFLSLIIPVFAAENEEAAEFYNKGIDFYEQDKIEESVEMFRKAIEIDPEFYEAYYNLARVEESAGNTQEAILAYEKLLKLAPDDMDSTFEFGEFLYKKGYLAKAASYLTKIPDDSEYKEKTDAIMVKLRKRQQELAEEARLKTQEKLKSTVIENVPAPSGVVIDSSGNMYVASFTENKIMKFSKDGSSKTVFADKNNELGGPISVTIDSYDNIYVANYYKGTVIKLDKNAKPAVLLNIEKPYGINIDEDKNKIYITEQQKNSVVAFDITEVLKASSSAARRANKEAKEKEREAREAKEAKEAKVAKDIKEGKVIIVPEQSEPPIGTPSIIEAPFAKQSPQGNITAPIMIPSGSAFD